MGCGFCCFCHCRFNECQHWSLSPSNNFQADILLTTSAKGWRWISWAHLCSCCLSRWSSWRWRVSDGVLLASGDFIWQDRRQQTERPPNNTDKRISRGFERQLDTMKRDVGSEFTTAGSHPPTLHWICSVTLRVLLKLSGTGAASVKLGPHHCDTASARTVVAGCFYHNLANTDNR